MCRNVIITNESKKQLSSEASNLEGPWFTSRTVHCTSNATVYHISSANYRIAVESIFLSHNTFNKFMDALVEN